MESQAPYLQRLSLARKRLQVTATNATENRKEDVQMPLMMVSGEVEFITHVTHITKSSYVALLVVSNSSQ